jgi:hypothetical protein
MNKLQFFPSLAILTGVLALFILGFQHLQSQVSLSNLVWGALIYYLLLTAFTYKISYSGLPKDNKTFITRIYGAIGIRFLFSVFPLFIYLIFSPERQISFAIVYLFLYFFYTAFEIYFLVVNLRPVQKK